jgi:hypothetical protein
MEPEGSLAYSQQLITGHNTEADASGPHPPTLFW